MGTAGVNEGSACTNQRSNKRIQRTGGSVGDSVGIE